MGGTLPAAGRAVETADDVRHFNLAVIYGANTLGAVLGVLLSTFYLLEQLGNRNTLWVACAANVVVALAAMAVSRSTTQAATAPSPKAQESSKSGGARFFRFDRGSRRWVCLSAHGSRLVSNDDAPFGRDDIHLRADFGRGLVGHWLGRRCLLFLWHKQTCTRSDQTFRGTGSFSKSVEIVIGSSVIRCWRKPRKSLPASSPPKRNDRCFQIAGTASSFGDGECQQGLACRGTP
jgi:hypothetical protein